MVELTPQMDETLPSSNGDRGDLDRDDKTTWGDRFRWVFWRRLPFGGLAGALVFFCLSLTPSLLPRVALLQGAVAGITMVIGYGLGSAVSSLIRKIIKREPGTDVKRVAWWVLLAATVILVPLFLYLGWRWQDQVRGLMEMEEQAVGQWGATKPLESRRFGWMRGSVGL